MLQTQAKLGRVLPHGYVARMCRQNGGEVNAGQDVWELFPIFDGSDRKRLSRTCNDIVRETERARKRPDFPPAAIAIGANGSGDLLILLPDSDGERYADAVYWWDHETGAIEQVADGFEDLER